MSKKIKIVIVLIFLAIIIGTNIVSYNIFNKYNTSKNKLDEANKELAIYKMKVNNLEEKVVAENSNNDDKVKDVADKFIKAYYTYTAKNQHKVYKNIKPYCTEALVNKVKPYQELGSDYYYEASIENIKLYYDKVDSNKANILVFADQKISTEKVEGTPSPILVELTLIFENNKWLVNDISVNIVKNQYK